MSRVRISDLREETLRDLRTLSNSPRLRMARQGLIAGISDKRPKWVVPQGTYIYSTIINVRRNRAKALVGRDQHGQIHPLAGLAETWKTPEQTAREVVAKELGTDPSRLTRAKLFDLMFDPISKRHVMLYGIVDNSAMYSFNGDWTLIAPKTAPTKEWHVTWEYISVVQRDALRHFEPFFEAANQAVQDLRNGIVRAGMNQMGLDLELATNRSPA